MLLAPSAATRVTAAQAFFRPVAAAPHRDGHAVAVLHDGHDLAAALHPAAAHFVDFDQGRLDDVLPAVEDLRVGAGNVVDPDRRRWRAVHEEVHQPDRVGALRDGVAKANGGQEFLRPRPEVVGPGIRPDLGSLLQDQAIDTVVAQGTPVVSPTGPAPTTMTSAS